jgi:hypothetical protein
MTGDTPPNPVEKPGYQLEFHEEFDTPILNTERWLPSYLPHWAGGRNERNAPRYSLPGKGLQLHIEADQQPWLPEVDGPLRVSALQTGCCSGPVGSSAGQLRFNPNLRVRAAQPATRLYTPRFGYFETRFRAVPVPGYMVAFWMIGFEEQPEHSGEICICEVFGKDMTATSAKVCSGVHAWGDPTLHEEFYVDDVAFDASRFHIYAVDWQPDRLDFFVDNRLLRTVHQSPQYEMQFMLTFYELPHQFSGASAQAVFPLTCHVDYVRGYRRLENPH